VTSISGGNDDDSTRRSIRLRWKVNADKAWSRSLCGT